MSRGMVSLKMDGPDLRQIANDVLAMMLPPRMRRLWLARMGRMVIAQAQKNVREQKTVDGKPMTPRKREPPARRAVYHRNGGKTFKKTHPEMLFDLMKSKWIGVRLVSDDEAKVSFFRNAGVVASKHQFGTTEVFYREQEDLFFPEEVRTPRNRAYWAYCTPEQARFMIRCGFPKKEQWIVTHLHAGQAYNIVRKIKKSWDISVPARPFLGMDEKQKRVIGDALMNGIYERFKTKNHSSLLK